MPPSAKARRSTSTTSRASGVSHVLEGSVRKAEDACGSPRNDRQRQRRMSGPSATIAITNIAEIRMNQRRSSRH
jgi:hypothetical protein